MHITVLHEYSATHVPPRCRKARDILLHDRMIVAIREISAAEAPVAIRYQLETPWEDADTTGSGVIELRWFDGRLWGESAHEAAKLPRLLGIAEPRSWSVARDEASGEVRDYTQHAESVRKIAEAADNFLLIDGKLHAYADEPYWSCSSSRHYGSLRLALADPQEIGPDWGSAYSFRADQLEMARASMAREVGEFQIRSSCDILIPQALRLDPYGRARRRSLEKIGEAIDGLFNECVLATPNEQSTDIAKALGSAIAALAAKLGWNAHEKMGFAETLLSAFSESGPDAD